MDPRLLIPHYQPLPLPAPLWLLQFLLLVGFFLHAVPMNVVLGGSLVASGALLAGRKDRTSFVYRTGAAVASSLPLFISFAITKGIVPLLFLQLLYGPAYYTSSVLMAVPWISIIFLLLVAYYASYAVIYRNLRRPHGDKTGFGAPLLLFCASIIFIAIAFLFTNNMTLMLQPQKWFSMYQASANGLNISRGDPQLFPRFLHFLVAALAVTGLFVGCFGLRYRKTDPQYSAWLISRGSLLFVLPTLLQIPVGIWFLFSLPEPIRQGLLGADAVATGAFVLSMSLALVSLLSATVAWFKQSAPAFTCALVSALLTIASMIVVRHEVRTFFLHSYLAPESLPVRTQFDLLAVFLTAAVALIAYLAWLVRLVLTAYSKPGESPKTLPITEESARYGSV